MRVPSLGWTPRWNRMKSNFSGSKLPPKTINWLNLRNQPYVCLDECPSYILFWMFFILVFDLAWGVQRLDVGSQFPDQGWNMGLCGKKRRVWTHRSLPPTPGNSLLDVSFLENQQLLPFHPIRQEEQQKWKTLLACYYMLVSLGQWP